MSENYTYINDDLLVKYLLDEASPEERQLVEEWMAASEANRNHLIQMKKVWEESHKLSAQSKVDEDAAWNRFLARTRGETLKSPVQLQTNRGWMRIAALFILIVSAALFAYTYFGNKKPVQQLALRTSESVLVDTLSDGSVITLNTNSELRYPEKFRGDKRTVSLRGEAFFNISPDKKRPFEIQVNDVTIKVVGTSFNIRTENGITEVIVETGIVQVTRKGKTVELRPQQKLVVKPTDSTMIPEKEKEKLYNYYRSKEFVCDGTPLWKLVEVLSEAYDVNIVIERPELRNLLLDVTFSNESLDVILEVIKETFNTHHIEIRRTADRISLR